MTTTRTADTTHTGSTATMPLDTPIGRIVLESDGDVLIGLRLPNAAEHGRRDEESPVLKEAAKQLEEYFAGERTDFDLRMELDGTPFQRAVWAELSRIPYGETISYGELARRVGRPRGPRAVGQANGRNPIAIIVPCHRVLASNGIGGYGGGLPVKRALLALEGVTA
jgi:methylated-DNA-[protein]-cysteine S-methyltransferase